MKKQTEKKNKISKKKQQLLPHIFAAILFHDETAKKWMNEKWIWKKNERQTEEEADQKIYFQHHSLSISLFTHTLNLQ